LNKKTRFKFGALLAALLVVLSLVPATPVFAQTPTIILTPPSGPPGTIVTVNGTGFTINATGPVWFDTDHDGVPDLGEPIVSVPPVVAGNFSVTLPPVPTVAAGIYFIRADVWPGGPVEASAPFLVTVPPPPSIILSPTSGVPGIAVTVNGTAFTVGANGTVWFDSDGDGLFDAGEPSASVTAVTGNFSISLTVPAVPVGAYFIRADVPLGLPWEVSATFTRLGPTIALAPISGGIGTIVTVNGTGFTVGATGLVWFDTDHDGAYDPGEPIVPVPPALAGNFSVTLPPVPAAVAPGAYFIRADVPGGLPWEALATFTRLAPAITLTPTSGGPGTNVTVAGVGFTVGATGRVWFDTDHDGVFDVGEPEVPATAGAGGVIPPLPVLTVPAVPPGPYFIRADVPTPLPWEVSVTFTVPLPVPVLPTLLGPAPGATDVSLRPGFSWVHIVGATEYEVILSTESDLSPTIAGTPVRVPHPSWHVPITLAHGTTYFWAVRVTGPVVGPQSIGTFTTLPAPPPPPPPVVTPAWVWVLIAIGSVLVIVIVVLIFRTRRV
jgi:hypothetical protein